MASLFQTMPSGFLQRDLHLSHAESGLRTAGERDGAAYQMSTSSPAAGWFRIRRHGEAGDIRQKTGPGEEQKEWIAANGFGVLSSTGIYAPRWSNSLVY